MAGLAVLVLFIGGVSLVYLVSEQLGNNISRVQNAFGGLDEATRPPPTGALTFLLVGTDSRSDSTPAGVNVNGARSESDVVMVAQVAPDRKSATVVSIPRDSLVDIPGRGADRIAAAYAVGGPTLLIQTVEGLTALRIDHFAVIDFSGLPVDGRRGGRHRRRRARCPSAGSLAARPTWTVRRRSATSATAPGS